MSTGFSQNRLKIQIKTSCGKENNDMELNFELDRQSLIPLYAQLAQALKTAVLNGEIIVKHNNSIFFIIILKV
jgi:hypothetical protein